eukprot:2725191-Pyramimonas_sp.AAC.1
MDVLSWLKSEGNNWHAGLSTTWHEMVTLVDEIEGAWQVHKRAEEHTWGSLPKTGPDSLPMRRAAWVMENYGKTFKNSKNLYVRSKALYNNLTRVGAWDTFNALVSASGNGCDFQKPSLDGPTVILTMNSL